MYASLILFCESDSNSFTLRIIRLSFYVFSWFYISLVSFSLIEIGSKDPDDEDERHMLLRR
jgi:hypothetical protein